MFRNNYMFYILTLDEMKELESNMKVYELILSRINGYDNHDKAHDIAHLYEVLTSLKILKDQLKLSKKESLLSFISIVYHDVGLGYGDRKIHHEISHNKVFEDKETLSLMFSDGDIEIIAQAAFDHRASSGKTPRSKIGKIVADADRIGSYTPEKILYKCIQYDDSRQANDYEYSFDRTMDHIEEKYSSTGYLPKFNYWDSKDKDQYQKEFDDMVKDPKGFGVKIFDKVYAKYCKDNDYVFNKKA